MGKTFLGGTVIGPSIIHKMKITGKTFIGVRDMPDGSTLHVTFPTKDSTGPRLHWLLLA